MIKPAEFVQEQNRLEALKSYNILDSLPEKDYDNLTEIASQICNTEISLISLVDVDRQWFKSHFGLPVSETPRAYSFCAHAIHDLDNILIVNDARNDERFYDNPLVLDDPNIVFYAGVPLAGEDGMPLGTLCVIDSNPKELTTGQINALKALANQVMNLFELRKSKIALENSLISLEKVNTELEKFAYIAAHDLKSPLNNITALTELFLDTNIKNIDEEGLKIIEIISL